MGEALFSKIQRGYARVYRWKQYQAVGTNTYYWNRYNVVSTTTYKWNKWNAVSTTKYVWNTYNIKYNLTKHIDTESGTHNPPVSHLSVNGASGSSNGPFKAWYQTYVSDDYGFVSTPGGDTTFFYGSNKTSVNVQNIYYNTSKTALETPGWITRADPYSRELWYSTHYRVLSRYHNDNGYYVDAEFYYTKHAYVTCDSSERGSYIGQVTSSSSTAYPSNGAGSYIFPPQSRWFVYDGPSTSWSKGTTSYGQVSSTNSSAYPSNGASGSYWYESAGSSTSYSKGSTSYGQVSSTNRSAYPDNNYSGSYWYVYSRYTTTWFQGEYIGDRLSTDRDRWPDNGRDGDYWYVFDGEA